MTTVSQTLNSILAYQPSFLSLHFEVKIAASDDGYLETVSIREGVAAYNVPMVRGINPLYDLYSLIRMVFLLVKIKPDIIHSYTPKAGLISMLAGLICFVPIRIHTFTGLIFPTSAGIKRFVLVQIDRLICACATNVIPEGNGVLNDLKVHKITNKDLAVIGFGNIAGVDTKLFDPELPSIRLESTEILKKIAPTSFIFSYIGRLNNDKGIKELVQAFCRIGASAKLLIVGGADNSSLDPETIGLITSNKNIHLLGFLNDVRPVLASTDVFVLPSYREGFPNVLLEAGAMKKPAIVTDINGSNEIIMNNNNGWVVPPKDSDSLYDAMVCSMKTDHAILMQMGHNARNLVCKKFDRSMYWDCLLNFYNGFTSEKIR